MKMQDVEKLIAEEKEKNESFKEEINSKMEIEHEGPYGLIDAFDEVLDRCDEEGFGPKECKSVKNIIIKTGMVEEGTKEALSKIQTYPPSKKWWFKHEGKKWIFEKRLDEVVEPKII